MWQIMWRCNDEHVGDVFSRLKEKGTQHKRGLRQREDACSPIELEVSFERSNRDIHNADGYTNFGSE